MKQGMVVVIGGMLVDVFVNNKKPINFKKIDESFSAIETRYGSGYRWNVS